MKRTIVILLLFAPFVNRAGCPMPDILAICEVKTFDNRTMLGIIYLYKGGFAEIMAPNGFYESRGIDESNNLYGFFHYFSLRFRKLEIAIDEQGDKNFMLYYAHSLYDKNCRKYKYDTVRSHSYPFELYYTDHGYDDWLFPKPDSIYYYEGKKMIIPTSELVNSHYFMSDSLYLYQELEEYKPCLIVRPSATSVDKIPMSVIKSITILTKPSKYWLEKIETVKTTVTLSNSTKWLHEILESKKTTRNFLSVYGDNLLVN